MTMLTDDLTDDRTTQGSTHQVGYVEEGVVTSVAADGVRFTLEAFGDAGFGPAPYGRWVDASALGPDPHTHTMTGPQAGNRCLVAFPGGDTSQPWVIGWTG